MKFAITSLLISIVGFPYVVLMALSAGYSGGGVNLIVRGIGFVCLTASLLALVSLKRREKRWLSVVALVIALMTPMLLVGAIR